MGHFKGHEFWWLILDLRGTESKNPFYEQRLLAAWLIVIRRLGSIMRKLRRKRLMMALLT